MRKIGLGPILVFSLLFALILILGIGTTGILFGRLPLGDFRGIALVAIAIICIYLYAFMVYRLFLTIAPPLKEGYIAAGSRDELVAQVNILFYLTLFNSLIRTHFLPVFLLRLVYIALGARLGANTYSAGVIYEPSMVTIGDNCLIGHDAVLFPHATEGDHFSFSAIRIGNNVTIGALSVIMQGVTIGDNAMVAAGAVVTKGTHIGMGEVWGGVPAKFIKRK